MTEPNDGSESWDVGSTQYINWTKKGALSTVKLLYSSDSGSTFTTLTGATGITAGDGSWAWTIGQAVATGPNGRIRVQDEALSIVKDDSDFDFEVKGSLTLTAPDPDDANIELRVGDAYSITWTKNGNVGNVDIYYSTDNGTSYPTKLNGSPVAASSRCR